MHPLLHLHLQAVIGQRGGVSPGDIALVKHMYSCASTTASPATTAAPVVCKQDVHLVCAQFEALGWEYLAWECHVPAGGVQVVTV